MTTRRSAPRRAKEGSLEEQRAKLLEILDAGLAEHDAGERVSAKEMKERLDKLFEEHRAARSGRRSSR
jgi:predicted transcriptional regulator